MDCIFSKIRDGARISREEAVILYQGADLHDLGMLASHVRRRSNPGDVVTYLVDRNINYTNICNTNCSFCGFYRCDSQSPDAYVLSKETIGQKIEEALSLGATRILLQGGHNDALPYSYYTELISWIHRNYPIEINSFSPSEIKQMALVSGKQTEEILKDLLECGMKGLPGAGAEILDDDIRKKFSPKKLSANEWLAIMGEAHRLRLTTTATMVIGFGESIEQRLNHLEKLRGLQDRSRSEGLEGFVAFVSWILVFNENTSVGRSRHRSRYGVSATEYLRNVALSRIYLDNFQHHQASWPTLGADIAQIALHFGCDDIGSTMMEENVVSKAGAPSQDKWTMSPKELRQCISGAGFVPARRNTSFEVLEKF